SGTAGPGRDDRRRKLLYAKANGVLMLVFYARQPRGGRSIFSAALPAALGVRRRGAVSSYCTPRPLRRTTAPAPEGSRTRAKRPRTTGPELAPRRAAGDLGRGTELASECSDS